MTKLWVDPPEGWKFGFPAIYDSEADGQMSEWIVSKGYPLQTIKEYGEQWFIRCWPAEESEKCPDQDITYKLLPETVKNDPIGTLQYKSTRAELREQIEGLERDYDLLIAEYKLLLAETRQEKKHDN
jgi:hypothetical protein